MAAGDDVDGAGVREWREVGTLPGKGVEMREKSWSGCVWWGCGELDELNSFDVILLPSRRLAATNLRPASQDAVRRYDCSCSSFHMAACPFVAPSKWTELAVLEHATASKQDHEYRDLWGAVWCARHASSHMTARVGDYYTRDALLLVCFLQTSEHGES